ncbi:glycosyl hydrolase [Geopyxis carbonaria]|nr:glycosyl hydrolase [Geopyxis carbonaria]
MLTLVVPLLLASAMAIAAPQRHLALPMASSMLARSPPLGHTKSGTVQWNYEHALFERALLRAAAAPHTPPQLAKNFTDYSTMGVDRLIAPDGTLLNHNISEYSLDSLCVGGVMLDLYKSTGEERYKTAAQALMQQVYTQPRNPAGGFWHYIQFRNQMWLDGLYMASPFYAAHTSAFQPENATAWSDIATQFTLAYTNTLDNTTGLLYHAYDSSRTAAWAGPDRGHSPEVWDRALGWYMMALVDVLDVFPRAHPGYKTLVGYLRALAAAVMRADHAGGWWLMMLHPSDTAAGNYRESSGSAMFVYALLKAARQGHVDARTRAFAEHEYWRIAKAFVREESNGNGTLAWTGTVEGIGIREDASAAFYYGKRRVVNDLKGVGPFVLAGLEMEAGKEM